MTERCALIIARALTRLVPIRAWRRRWRDAVRYALLTPPSQGDTARHHRFLLDFVLDDSPVADLTLPMSVTPLVSIVIPVYNNYTLTMCCLRSIERTVLSMPIEVILADDASTDETASIASHVKGLRVARSAGNLRFLRNCNQAAQQARGKYVLFLNNDTQVLFGWLHALVDVLEHDATIGLAGSMLLNPDGTVQEAGVTMPPNGDPQPNGGRNPAPWRRAFTGLRDVDYVSGAAMLLSRALWEKLGGFDELFAPAYYEDADLAFRVRQAGLRVVCVQESKVIHCCGASSGQRGAYAVNAEKFCRRWFAGKEGVC